MANSTIPKTELNPTGKNFYEILWLEKNATREDITKRYRLLAQTYHPDKPTGDPEKMTQLNHIRDILLDERRRQIYDQYGEKAAEMYDKYDRNIPMEVLGNQRQMAAAFFIFTMLFCLALLFIIFIGIRVDLRVNWNYFVVAIPLWIIDFLMVATTLGLTLRWWSAHKKENSDAAKAEQGDEEMPSKQGQGIVSFITLLSWWIAVPLFIAFQILIFLKVQGAISWSWAKIFLFWWIIEGEIFVKKTIGITKDIVARNQYHKQTPIDHSLNNASLEMRILKMNLMLFFLYRAIKKYFWCVIRIWFEVFVVLQIDNVVLWNWAIVFLPLFVGFGSYFVIGILLFDNIRISCAGSEKEKERMAMIRTSLLMLLAVVFSCALATFGMFIVRENGTTFYGMVTVFIPIYVLLSLAICCFCCVLPCAMTMMTQEDPNVHFSNASAPNGDNNAKEANDNNAKEANDKFAGKNTKTDV